MKFLWKSSKLSARVLSGNCFKDVVKVKDKEDRDKEMVEQMEIDMSYEEAKERIKESLQLLDYSPIKYVTSEEF